jgi:hypothetical protein
MIVDSLGSPASESDSDSDSQTTFSDSECSRAATGKSASGDVAPSI